MGMHQSMAASVPFGSNTSKDIVPFQAGLDRSLKCPDGSVLRLSEQPLQDRDKVHFQYALNQIKMLFT